MAAPNGQACRELAGSDVLSNCSERDPASVRCVRSGCPLSPTSPCRPPPVLSQRAVDVAAAAIVRVCLTAGEPRRAPTKSKTSAAATWTCPAGSALAPACEQQPGRTAWVNRGDRCPACPPSATPSRLPKRPRQELEKAHSGGSRDGADTSLSEQYAARVFIFLSSLGTAMDAPPLALPDDIWDAVAGHLPAQDLLSLSRCGRVVRRACLAAVHAAVVVVARGADGARVRVFLNPRSPPPRPVNNFDVPFLVHPPSPTSVTADGALPASQAVATSLLFFLRTTRVRRMGLCGGRDEQGGLFQGATATPFWSTLLGGLTELSLRELTLDGVAAGAATPAARLPPRLEALSVTGLAVNQPVQALPIIHAMLSNQTCSLRSLRIHFVPEVWIGLDPAAHAAMASYVQLPLPELRHLALCGALGREAARAIAGLSGLTSLELLCSDRAGAVAELALPALPALRHLDLADASVPDGLCEEALVRGRVLQTLAPSRAPADGERLVRMTGLGPALPVNANIFMAEEHCDIRPLCHHQRRDSLRALSVCLSVEVGSILAAAARSLPGLRELSLYLGDPSSEFCRWPSELCLERLSLQAWEQISTITLLRMVAELGRSHWMRRHLRRLDVTADAPLRLAPFTSLRSLGGLRRLDIVFRSAAAVAADDRQQWEAAVRSTVCGSIQVHWLNF